MTDLDRLIVSKGLLDLNRRLTEAHRRLQALAWDDRSLRELLRGWTAQREEILTGILEAP